MNEPCNPLAQFPIGYNSVLNNSKALKKQAQTYLEGLTVFAYG